MLKVGKKPLPMIGKISEMLVSSKGAGFFDVGSSPRGPLDLKMQLSPSQSPRVLKSFHDVGGVGLGIVAALEKTSHNKYAVCGHKSDLIPVKSGRNSDEGLHELEEEDSEENYTIVTCHGRNKSVAKVIYYDGGDCTTKSSGHHQYVNFGPCPVNLNQNQKQKPKPKPRQAPPVYPTSEFLSSCHLCNKKLDGRDIYMYRGEKAFCSTECRATQMMNDERKEQCRSEASRRSTDVTSSSYSTDVIFFSTGILAI